MNATNTPETATVRTYSEMSPAELWQERKRLIQIADIEPSGELSDALSNAAIRLDPLICNNKAVTVADVKAKSEMAKELYLANVDNANLSICDREFLSCIDTVLEFLTEKENPQY